MHVSVDAYVASESFGGFISYIEGVTRGLAALPETTLELFAPRQRAFDFLSGLASERVAVRVVDLALSDDERRREGEVWAEDVLPQLLARARPDVHLGPSFLLPPWEGPKAVTVHDAMFELFPQFYSDPTRDYLIRSTRTALQRADVVLAVSEATRRDATTYWHPRAPVVVTPLAPNLDPVRPAASSPHPRPYLLNVGGSHRRKRLDVLVEAFGLLLDRGDLDRTDLVIANCAEDERVETLVRQSPVGERIHLTDRIPPADLPSWYAHAELFVYPSDYEGFGLTPLEAMTCGTPVVTARNSSLAEMLGEAVVYTDCGSPAALATAVGDLVRDPSRRRELAAAGRVRAGTFSWARTAALTRTALQQAVAAH